MQSKEIAFKLLKDLFGPNTFTHLSVKKNMDVITPLCLLLDKDQIQDYIQGWLGEQYDNPQLSVFYAGDQVNNDEENGAEMKQAIKQSII